MCKFYPGYLNVERLRRRQLGDCESDTATVHLDSYTLKKNSSGNPITRTVEIDWEFDRLTQVPD